MEKPGRRIAEQTRISGKPFLNRRVRSKRLARIYGRQATVGVSDCREPSAMGAMKSTADCVIDRSIYTRAALSAGP